MAVLPAALHLGQCLYSGGGLIIIADNQLDGNYSSLLIKIILLLLSGGFITDIIQVARQPGARPSS